MYCIDSSDGLDINKILLLEKKPPKKEGTVRDNHLKTPQKDRGEIKFDL